MTRLKVVWIVGSAYCGSSLLNVLLDTQPNTRGVGEGAKVYHHRKADGPCTRCMSPVAQCQLYAGVDPAAFYEQTAAYYGGCHSIVDSSKHAVWLVEHTAQEPACEYFAILLSKTPHEQAYSLLQHNQWDHWNSDDRHRNVDACFQTYVRTYRKYVTVLRDFFGSEYPDRVLPMHYRDIATDPTAAVRAITEWLGIEFNDSRLATDWRTTDTHILGGNPSIISQVTRDAVFAFAVPPSTYLNGKYDGRDGCVFVDEAWRTRADFLQQCQATYGKSLIPTDLLSDLGHGSPKVLEADLLATISERL